MELLEIRRGRSLTLLEFADPSFVDELDRHRIQEVQLISA
jgi:hypothetical protein